MPVSSVPVPAESCTCEAVLPSIGQLVGFISDYLIFQSLRKKRASTQHALMKALGHTPSPHCGAEPAGRLDYSLDHSNHLSTHPENHSSECVLESAGTCVGVSPEADPEPEALDPVALDPEEEP